MKKWKKILHNCPYLIALSVTWLFLTVGGFLLVWYRDYEGMKWQDMLSNPFFAVVMEQEVQGKEAQPTLAKNKEKTDVIKKDAVNKEKNNDKKLNINIINEYLGESISGKQDSNCPDSPSKESGVPAIVLPDVQVVRETKGDMQVDEEGKWKLIEPAQIPETETSVSDQEVDAEEKEASDAATVADDKGEKEVSGNKEGNKPGITRFIDYPPIETDSIYYSDAGKIALTTEYDYRKVNENYFTDAAFIGDSRTLGISDYAGLDADFYCENGMTIYKLFGEKGITWQKNGQKVNLSQVLQQKQYGKIYIMLGMNELGYGDTEKYLEQYRTVVAQIREWQPQAVIFILANLHVSREKNNMATEFNNVNINDKNAASASLADGVNVFYLDSNPLFTDNDGFLKSDLTFDGVHLYADNYESWKEFFMEHGVVKDGNGSTGNSIK